MFKEGRPLERGRAFVPIGPQRGRLNSGSQTLLKSFRNPGAAMEAWIHQIRVSDISSLKTKNKTCDSHVLQVGDPPPVETTRVSVYLRFRREGTWPLHLFGFLPK